MALQRSLVPSTDYRYRDTADQLIREAYVLRLTGLVTFASTLSWAWALGHTYVLSSYTVTSRAFYVYVYAIMKDRPNHEATKKLFRTVIPNFIFSYTRVPFRPF